MFWIDYYYFLKGGRRGERKHLFLYSFPPKEKRKGREGEGKENQLDPRLLFPTSREKRREKREGRKAVPRREMDLFTDLTNYSRSLKRKKRKKEERERRGGEKRGVYVRPCLLLHLERRGKKKKERERIRLTAAGLFEYSSLSFIFRKKKGGGEGKREVSGVSGLFYSVEEKG